MSGETKWAIEEGERDCFEPHNGHYTAPSGEFLIVIDEDNQAIVTGLKARQFAHLIAASPELYAALEHIIEMNRTYMRDKCGDPDEAETMSCVVVARAALAKARGESQ